MQRANSDRLIRMLVKQIPTFKDFTHFSPIHETFYKVSTGQGKKAVGRSSFHVSNNCTQKRSPIFQKKKLRL